MRLSDLRGCAQTSTVLDPATVSTRTSTNPFWSSCVPALYDAAQFRNLHSLPLANEVSRQGSAAGVSNGSLNAKFAGMHTQTSAQQSGHQELKGLPCPTLYQAKEPEAISDVLRRAGKKALGGGIPGQ